MSGWLAGMDENMKEHEWGVGVRGKSPEEKKHFILYYALYKMLLI